MFKQKQSTSVKIIIPFTTTTTTNFKILNSKQSLDLALRQMDDTERFQANSVKHKGMKRVAAKNGQNNGNSV